MTGVSRQSVLIRQITAVFAGHTDSVAHAAPLSVSPIVWSELGWSSKLEHDEMLAEVRVAARGHLSAVRRYVTAERHRRGLPPIPPYTVEQMDVLDQIIRTAPAIVEQDAAAEQVA